MKRINALIRKCRHRGGDCSCPLRCQARDEVVAELVQAEQAVGAANRRLEQAKVMKRHLEAMPCTVKPGWTMPPKPDGDYAPMVYIDYDECHMHWYSETESIDQVDMDLKGDSAWPFVEDYAYREDWERLGFTVVY